MKKAIFYISLLLGCFLLTGCNNQEKLQMKHSYIEAIIDSENQIVIEKSTITDVATFINYRIEEVVIQMIAVRAKDGTVRLALNTCQSCSPSPKAYFIQEGDYFVCQNCGTKFYVDEIGISKGGCNPAPVKIHEEDEERIIIEVAEIAKYKEKFKNWEGRTI